MPDRRAPGQAAKGLAPAHELEPADLGSAEPERVDLGVKPGRIVLRRVGPGLVESARADKGPGKLGQVPPEPVEPEKAEPRPGKGQVRPGFEAGRAGLAARRGHPDRDLRVSLVLARVRQLARSAESRTRPVVRPVTATLLATLNVRRTGRVVVQDDGRIA